RPHVGGALVWGVSRGVFGGFLHMAQYLARSNAADLIPADALARIPGFAAAGPSARVERLHGGTVNASFRVDTGAGQFVVRIHDPVAATLGADHEREARLHAAAAAAGLAPTLIYVDASHSFMIMEYEPGPLWTAQDMGRPDRLSQLGAALHTLHSVAPPHVAPYEMPLVLGRLYDQLRAALPEESSWLAQLMDRATTALASCGTTERPQALIHNDLHHSNLVGIKHLYLLDWEYAAVTDPLFDLACLLAYYPNAAPHANLLLNTSGLSNAASPEMLHHATWTYVLLSYFWYRSRRLSAPATPAEQAAEQSLLARLR
ncbi:MAG TPA: phosphotransferase, partial [Steroidobacteraceae bacterium]|nr:phosphotransferase [Steroidobacteraceae bacterium]